MLPDPHLSKEEDICLDRRNSPSLPVATSPTRCEPAYSQQVHALAAAVPQQFLSAGTWAGGHTNCQIKKRREMSLHARCEVGSQMLFGEG